jgi:hypothetical protein
MKQIEWRVRLACAERGIWSAAELQRLVLRRTGIHLSVQTLQAWFRSLPVRIEVRTLKAVLNALGCDLADLIQYEPPKTEKDARATAKEAIHPGQKAKELLAKHRKTKQRGRPDRPQPNVKKMLEALAESSAPLAREQLKPGPSEAPRSQKTRKKISKSS